MKKILLIIALFFLFPITTLAADYKITNYYIDAKVLENGDMNVSELIVLKGSFNGYERDILYRNSLADPERNASGIENIVVYAKYVDDVSFNTFDESFNKFEKSVFANNGDKGKYILSNLSDGNRIRMYYHTDNRKTAFLITYTLKDVVTIHDEEGFGEVYWTFIGDGFEDSINDLQIRVTLPTKDNSEYFRVWAHGEVNGEVRFLDDENVSGLLATSIKVDHNTPTDIRMTFDKKIVNKTNKTSDKTFEEIINNEERLAAERNALRKEIKIKYNTCIIMSVILYIYLVVSWIYIYIKYDKERKPEFNLQYNREFIDDYNVEVVDYLMNKGITENAMSASIMNLIYKKNIKADKIEDKKDSYEFTLLNRDNINSTENALLDFLFVKIGDGTKFTTVDLKKYASSTQTCNTFMNTYTAWKNKVIADGEKEEFFEKNKNYVWLSFLSLVFGVVLIAFMASNNIEFIPGYLYIFFCFVFLVYTLLFTKRTKKGVEHYAKWKAFKNFLNDFGNFSVKELPEVILWERYLVYATIFGLADKLEKTMNVKIKEVGTYDFYDGYYMYNTHMFNINLAHSINHAMNSAVNSSRTTINRLNANSSMSSGSGFGGGFSGGAGFGGGGGGGRGF